MDQRTFAWSSWRLENKYSWSFRRAAKFAKISAGQSNGEGGQRILKQGPHCHEWCGHDVGVCRTYAHHELLVDQASMPGAGARNAELGRSSRPTAASRPGRALCSIAAQINGCTASVVLPAGLSSMGKSCTARCCPAICSFRHCFIGAHLFAIVDDKRRDIFCDAVAELVWAGTPRRAVRDVLIAENCACACADSGEVRSSTSGARSSSTGWCAEPR